MQRTDATRSRRSVATALGLLALAALAGLASFAVGRYETSIALGPFVLLGFEPCGAGCFRAVETPDRFHLIESAVAPVAGDDYRLGLVVRRLPGATLVLGADFFAAGYDDGDQEGFTPLDMAALARGVRFGWNAGAAPAQARARVFYTGPPGVELGEPALVRAPGWAGPARQALCATAALALLGVAALAGADLARRFAAPPWRGEALALATLYLALVPVRTLQYVATPLWVGDEYAYKSLAAGIFWLGGVAGLDPDRIAHSVAYPNLVYPVLIAPSIGFGNDFHLVLRAINAALICAAVFPAYAIARRFLSARWSFAFAAFAATIPFTSLGAFAMTEVAFYPLFLVWAWTALRALAPEASTVWPALSGALVGLLMNVRPNAPVLLAVLVLGLLWVAWAEGRSRTRAVQAALLVAPLACLIVATSIRVATHAGTLAQPDFYNRVWAQARAAQAGFPFDAYLDLALGHLAGVAVPYGLPIALAGVGLGAAVRGRWHGDAARFTVLALLAAAGLVAVALAFTRGVAPFDLGGLGRWHARYYFPATPLLLLAGVVAARRTGLGTGPERVAALVATALLLALGGLFVFGRAAFESPWFGSIADGMDVQWLRHHEALYLVFALATLGVGGLVCARSSRGPGAAALALGGWLVVANAAVLGETRVAEPDPGSACGRLAGILLEGAPGRFAIAADERGGAIRTGFAIPYLPERVAWGEGLEAERHGGPWRDVDVVVAYGAVAPAASWKTVLEVGECRVYRTR